MAPDRRGSTVLEAAVDRLVQQGAPTGAAQVLDLGGGTGGQAVRLATAGHRVTVVDPSPDALAALARRAEEAGVGQRVDGLQGDAENLGDLLAAECVDVVLCHGVLEVVDDPDVALAAVRRVLREHGRLSLLVTQRDAAVLHRVGAGHLRQAARIVADPSGRWGGDDPLQRRFDLAQVDSLLARHGLRSVEVDGVRVLSDLVPRSSVDGDPAAEELLASLEAHAATNPALRAVAAQLHVHAAVAGQ